MSEATRSTPDVPEPEPGQDEEFPELVVGRGRFTEFALKRLKASVLLQVSMAVAFLCYGALIFLVIYQENGQPMMPFGHAGLVVVMSLASWFFLFWWYPVLERTLQVLGDDPRRAWISRTLETVAIGCVVVVHLLMVGIILARAGVLT